MKYMVLFFAGSLFVQTAFAQDGYGSSTIYDPVVHLPNDRHIFIVPPNAEWSQQNWKDSIYLYDEFQVGRLEMSNGFKPSHKPMLNYNPMTEGMSIKTSTGEIVSMRKSPAIKYVWIGDHKFINDPVFGYLEVISEGKAILAQKVIMMGAYETSNGSKYPLKAVDEMSGGTTFVKTPLKRNTRYFWKEIQLFLVGSDMKAFRMSPYALKHLLPKEKREIKEFAKTNHVNYRVKEDVVKLVIYANKLDSLRR